MFPSLVVPQEREQGYVPWKGASRPHVGPSQTSSVDEGVADMDSQWDDATGSMASSHIGMGGQGHSHGSSVSSGIAGPAIRSRADWKWPARGSSGSSVLISSDMSQVWLASCHEMLSYRRFKNFLHLCRMNLIQSVRKIGMNV